MVCLLSACSMLHAQTYVDLTTEARQGPGGPQGGPAMRIMTFDHGQPTPLPIEVTVQDLYPVAIEITGRMTAVIRLRNVGQEPIAVPVSRDFSVLKPGNEDQRILDLSLVFTPPPPLKPFFIAAGSVAGSKSAPGSVLTLAPQETVTFRVAVPLTDTRKLSDAALDTARITVRAQVIESTLLSDEFTIVKLSPVAISRGEVEVFWHH